MSSDEWEEKDPKDAKILVLTLRIDELIKQQEKWFALATSQKSNPRLKSLNNSQQKDKIQVIVEWRMTKTEEMLEKDGKTWYWCPKYVVPVKYDGLYVTHKQEEHNNWKKMRELFLHKCLQRLCLRSSNVKNIHC